MTTESGSEHPEEKKIDTVVTMVLNNRRAQESQSCLTLLDINLAQVDWHTAAASPPRICQ